MTRDVFQRNGLVTLESNGVKTVLPCLISEPEIASWLTHQTALHSLPCLQIPLLLSGRHRVERGGGLEEEKEK